MGDSKELMRLDELEAKVNSLSSTLSSVSSTLSTVSSRVSTISSTVSSINSNANQGYTVVEINYPNTTITSRDEEITIYEHNGPGIFHQINMADASVSDNSFELNLYIDGINHTTLHSVGHGLRFSQFEWTERGFEVVYTTSPVNQLLYIPFKKNIKFTITGSQKSYFAIKRGRIYLSI